jgi:hypothetical protein
MGVFTLTAVVVDGSAVAEASPPAAAQGAPPACTDTFINPAGGNWFADSNWSLGHLPSPSDVACINQAGTYTVAMNGVGTSVGALLLGGSSGTQTLSIGSTCGFNASFSTTNGITISAAGVLSLTNGDGCGNNATLIVSNGGTLTNSGTIQSLPVNGGQRTLQGSLTNTGTVTINQPTSYNAGGTTFDNQGTVTIADGVTFTITSGAAFTNDTTGKVNASSASGSGALFVAGATFTEKNGATLGVNPGHRR